MSQEYVCDQEKMSSPLNIDGSHLKFSQYRVDTELLSVSNVSLQKNKSGFFEARQDFGVVSLEGRFFNLNRVTFVAKSETRVNNKQYDLEMQITGNDRENNQIVISILFEKSNIPSEHLLKLGIGSGILKKLENSKENLKTKARLLGSFSLDDFIKGNKHFLKFQGSTTEYPCGQGTWLVLYDTIPISENQLIEFPQVLRYSSKSAEASQ